MSKEVVVLSAVRSAIGTFGGSLANMEPADLATVVMKEAIARSSVDAALIGNAVPMRDRARCSSTSFASAASTA